MRDIMFNFYKEDEKYILVSTQILGKLDRYSTLETCISFAEDIVKNNRYDFHNRDKSKNWYISFDVETTISIHILDNITDKIRHFYDEL
jgi:hypothetical protein